MSNPPFETVDLAFSGNWEGLDYHRYFWNQCQGDVLLQSVNVQNGIFEFPGHFIGEYDKARRETESYYAYRMLYIWYHHQNRPIRYHFSHKSEAALFKLTFR